MCTSTHYYSSSIHCLQHRHHPKYLHNHHNQAGGFEPCRGGTYIHITSSYLNSFHCLHHRHLPKYLYLIIISFIRFYLTPSVSHPAVLAMSLILSIEGDFVHMFRFVWILAYLFVQIFVWILVNLFVWILANKFFPIFAAAYLSIKQPKFMHLCANFPQICLLYICEHISFFLPFV